jgi:secreted trypsin-like serine protease
MLTVIGVLGLSGDESPASNAEVAPHGLAAIISRAAPIDDAYAFTFCSGALLAPARVVTAAHCLLARSDVDVLVDPVTLCHPGPIGGQRIRVSWWRVRAGSSDVAVLHLAQPAGAPPMTVASRGSSDGTLTAWGWGGPEDGPPPCRATAKRIQAVDAARCVEASTPIAPDAWCAVPAEGPNTCRGDSGGPVLDAHGSLVAIVTGGLHCGPHDAGSYTSLGSRPRVGTSATGGRQAATVQRPDSV